MQEPPSVQVRVYSAKSQELASRMYAADSSALAAAGYIPTSQIWTPPRYWRVILTPLILLVAGWLILGIYGLAIAAAIGVVYVFAVRPKGTMTVTYTRPTLPIWGQ